MMHGRFYRLFLFVAVVCAGARADWKADVGYTSLSTRLGGAKPTGAGIPVTHVEAPSNGAPPYIYHPDEDWSELAGKSFTNECSTCDNDPDHFSVHASTVASYFYGISGSIAPGITTIGCNEVNEWINAKLFYAAPVQPPQVEWRRIQNHSWIAEASDASANNIDERFDLMIYRDGVVSAVGVNNGTASAIPRILASAYNGISVGLSSGGSSYGPVVAGMDGAGRVKPDIVVPVTATSWATPVVAGACALLLQAEDALGILGGSKLGKAMLAKALLLEGATKTEFGISSNGWRKGFSTPDATGAVPLDYRYGAGELNIDNSHRILTAAAQQPPGGASIVATTGWNYSAINAAATHQYFMDIPQGASLSGMVVWHRHVTHSTTTGALTPSMANIQLRLYNATNFTKGSLRDQSISAVDNVEYILQRRLPAGRYLFEVYSDSAWEYAFAWHIAIRPDFDRDGNVNEEDFNFFKLCRTGPNIPTVVPACQDADLDDDADVDSIDFGRFQRCHARDGTAINNNCWQ